MLLLLSVFMISTITSILLGGVVYKWLTLIEYNRLRVDSVF